MTRENLHNKINYTINLLTIITNFEDKDIYKLLLANLEIYYYLYETLFNKKHPSNHQLIKFHEKLWELK